MAQWDRSLRGVFFVLIASACYDTRSDHKSPPPSAAGKSGLPRATPIEPDQGLDSHKGLLRPLERFPISDPTQQAGPPTVGFVDDHWLVAWKATDSPDETPPHLEVATLDLEGNQVEQRRGPELAQGWPSFAFDAQGRLGVLYDGSPCSHRVYEANLQPGGAEFSLPCTDDYVAAASPIPGTDEWMVTYGSDTGDVVFGRYRPSNADWTTPTFAFGPGARLASWPLDVFAERDRAFVLWGDGLGTNVRTFDLLESGVAPQGEPVRLVRSTISDGNYALDRIENRTVVLATDGAGLWGAELVPNKLTVTDSNDIAFSVVLDQRPGTASAALLGVIGVCFGLSSSGEPTEAGGADHDSVAFVLVGPDGRATEAPIVLQDVGSYGGCDVAWSGDEFLVVYWHIEPASFGTDQIYSKIFAQRIATTLRL
jgi:hypothetical protein